ncbi:zinc ribbon domain-containing protein [Limosilactobacillus reuteri]|uniref:zinc ribbon domain-containing protein n=1 Tax=Limosilactobacillus reuteri TaxID=1598 RepID=UPI001E593B5F|nr:zinc ribbon domain-containing protein [Limosilactobacillus reuteri]MCC4412743.1 zinc ribbon domain-containing protein [Limosilactobacillus reuteri]
MRFCKHCGAELKSGQKFCEQCGNEVSILQSDQVQSKSADSDTSNPLKVTHQTNLDSSQYAEYQALKEQIAQLKRQQNEKINVFHRLAFSKEHWQQVFNFMNNNALTMLFFFILAVLLGTGRWYILVIFLLLTYNYPLLSGEKVYPWEKNFNKWLNNDVSDIRQKLMKLSNKVTESNKNFTKNSKFSNDESQTSSEVKKVNEQPLSRMTNNQDSHRHKVFAVKFEFITGIILMIIGGFMYFANRQAATNMGNQLILTLENGSLSINGYLTFWGLSLGVMGIAMLIGGIVNGFKRNNYGSTFKVLGSIVILAYGVVCSYIYANAINLGINATASIIDGQSSWNDYISLYHYITYLPIIGCFIYAIGILINGVSNDE